MMMAVLPQCLAVSNHIYDTVRALAESVCVCVWVCLQLSLKLCRAISVMLSTETTVRFLGVVIKDVCLYLAVRVHSRV